MPLLTNQAIKKELEEGNIKITPPLSDDQISVVSVDLTLADDFWVYKDQSTVIPIKEETNYLDYTDHIKTDMIEIKPQQTIIAITKEKINLPGNICGWLEGRSRFARLGLLIHISAGLIQPGVDNHQVLEITNLSPNTLSLHAGERICQLAFQRCEGEAFYKGRFENQ
ncbi:MAG: dCTP deaminase [Candidatus Pacebacteria bacterium]|nr:dCTP deaminase [Candidatus Paceibacterota bacterium]